MRAAFISPGMVVPFIGQSYVAEVVYLCRLRDPWFGTVSVECEDGEVATVDARANFETLIDLLDLRRGDVVSLRNISSGVPTHANRPVTLYGEVTSIVRPNTETVRIELNRRDRVTFKTPPNVVSMVSIHDRRSLYL